MRLSSKVVMTSVTPLFPRYGGGVRGCVDFNFIVIVGLGFDDLGLSPPTLGSTTRSRESIHVGGLCSINDSDTHHDPGRLPDLASQFSGTTKKLIRHMRPGLDSRALLAAMAEKPHLVL